MTDDEVQGTMGSLFSPSRLPLRGNFHRERDDVLVRGRSSSVISGIEDGRFNGYACRFTCIRTKSW